MFTDIISIFINVLTPVFGLVATGYFLGPRLRLETGTLSRIAYYVFVPAFVFHHISGAEIIVDHTSKLLVYIVTVHVIGALSGYGLARLLKRSKKKAAAFALIASFGNVGNFGVPIIIFRLGESAVVTATLYFVAINMTAFVIGVGAASWIRGTGLTAIVSVFKTPAIVVLIPALFFPISGTEIPLMLSRIMELLSGAMIPVMLIAMGLSMKGTVKIKMDLDVMLISGVRLALVPFLAFSLALFADISGVERNAAILQAGMPAAVLTWLIAREHDLMPDFVFSALVMSTICSLLTLTILLAWV
jgi:malate permease and related proteins